MKKIALLAFLFVGSLTAMIYAAETKKDGAKIPDAQLPVISATYVVTEAANGLATAEATGKNGPAFISIDDTASALKVGDEVRIVITVIKKTALPDGVKFAHGDGCKCRTCQQAREDEAVVDELFDTLKKVQNGADTNTLKEPLKKLLRD